MELHLDDDDTELLRGLLDGAYRDLRVEISNTDNPAFKRGLRAREAAIASLLERLGGPLAR